VKGIVFNLLETLVARDFGDEKWESLIESAGVSGAYTSLGSYPDADLFALVAAASEALALDPADVTRWFGRGAMPLFAERYPALFQEHRGTRSFVMTLNDIIHPEVRKLYPGAIVPVFDFDTSDPERLLMDYESPRKLCAFAEGLVQGAADHFDETVVIDQPLCMNRGDGHCRLAITFSG
jgi:hypothetical protein